ncbi:hypothetical protein [Candidatus Magnetominusculus xianensis]|uniref:Secreted protein n=1 Tax=Candidatus Magnetominusculus xianensis TaxID=1748249 RepID=A0ABR5SBJ7_9BACT|nr:hypothetical protein [Candidatus Magnetominusculus xianensis]KWT78147.1 hypothetical protein ASN18_3016 [Candidatus Magnetominusculus xianensis]
MRKITVMLFLLTFVMTHSLAFADADDNKWIAQCIKDNKKEGAKEEVVFLYCECMNSKMDSNETQSITQWEKSHPKEMKECEKKAGWK